MCVLLFIQGPDWAFVLADSSPALPRVSLPHWTVSSPKQVSKGLGEESDLEPGVGVPDRVGGRWEQGVKSVLAGDWVAG